MGIDSRVSGGAALSGSAASLNDFVCMPFVPEHGTYAGGRGVPAYDAVQPPPSLSACFSDTAVAVVLDTDGRDRRSAQTA